MTKSVRATVLDFRRANGLDVGEEHRRVWMAQLGALKLPLPNFKWRREAIKYHDAHHLLTGHSTAPSGELLVATWELGAGCFKDWRARALCQFLAVLSLISQPRLTREAFEKGRNQAAAYRFLFDQGFLDMPLSKAIRLLNTESLSAR